MENIKFIEEEKNYYAVIGTAVSLLSLWLFDVPVACFVMFALACWYIYEYPETLNIVFLSFLIGALSDLVLNIYSHRPGAQRYGRSSELQYYFATTGTVWAVVFAGLLVIWMVLPSMIFTDHKLDWSLTWIGFLVGGFLGIFAEDSQAIRNLKPFYSITSGQLENRAWDGISMTWVFLVLNFLNSQNRIKIFSI